MQRPIDVWNNLAAFWDDFLGEGNAFQKQLIMPITDRLLNVQPGERLLDACCGNGNYSRRLAQQGAKVVAFDGSSIFIDRARQKSSNIEYHVIDATDESQLQKLTPTFDAAVCSMALMDLPMIDPLLRAIHRILKPGGRFVFSVPHPCFSHERVIKTAKLSANNANPEQIFGVEIYDYITPFNELSIGILNQPEPHPIWHRPISLLLKCTFDAGFVLDALEEPTFPSDTSAKNPFSWAKRPEFPPAMICRLMRN